MDLCRDLLNGGDGPRAIRESSDGWCIDCSTPLKVGTVVVAHGGDSLWNAHVLEAARQVRTGGPVEVSFLMGPAAKARRFQDVIKRLEAAGVSKIIVVPMLVSSHSGHYEQIRFLAGDSVVLDSAMTHHLHMSGIQRPTSRVPLVLTRAMDDAPEIARVLADGALAMTTEPNTRTAHRRSRSCRRT